MAYSPNGTCDKSNSKSSWLFSTGSIRWVTTEAIAGVPDLMHHKFVVRDRASVWTGSMNWTDDSWSRQENIVAVVDSAGLGDAYARDFEQLWSTGAVEETGFVDPRDLDVGGVRVRAWFTPGHGDEPEPSRLARGADGDDWWADHPAAGPTHQKR